MKEKVKEDLLNEYQRRGLSSTFRILEEMMCEIETLINSDGFRGNLIVTENDILLQSREEIVKKIQLVREKVSHLSKQFALEMKQAKLSSQILADLSYCWETLEGSKAKRLRGYGEVEEGLEKVLDPQIDAIINLITEMENILKKH
ncbi:MAG: hypothetical protein FJ242_04685 [Nitrospira sp.]|nr:hypothetical protein [Nitrospira sp.]